MDKIVDDLVFMREGFRWWDEAMKRAQSLEPKKWTLDELEKQTERLNSLWV